MESCKGFMSFPPSPLLQPSCCRSDIEGKERREDGQHLLAQQTPLFLPSLLPHLLTHSISSFMMKIKIGGETWEPSTNSTPSAHLLNPDINCQISPLFSSTTTSSLLLLLHSLLLTKVISIITLSPLQACPSPVHFPHLQCVHLTIALSRCKSFMA